MSLFAASPDFIRHIRHIPCFIWVLGHFTSATPGNRVADRKSLEATYLKGCGGVADRNGGCR